jgi:MtN3 and saliva related transmembrane protein
VTGAIWINAVGVSAAICSMGSFVPQAVKIFREHDASAVSVRMYVVTVIGFALWSFYGVLLKSWPLAGSNLVSLSLAALILMLKLRYSRHARTKPCAEAVAAE